MSTQDFVDAASVQHPMYTDADGSQLQSQHFLEALTARRSIYALSPTSKVSDEKIKAIIRHAILHVPNAFNAQTARCLLLLDGESQKFWNNTGELLKASMPGPAWNFFSTKINEYKTGYGTCLFFDDREAWNGVAESLGHRWDGVKAEAPTWEEHSSGMLQYAVWVALSLESLACNLQHYNMPHVEAMTKETWNLPASWTPKAQLVFGTPVGGPRKVKQFQPVEEERMLMRKS